MSAFSAGDARYSPGAGILFEPGMSTVDVSFAATDTTVISSSWK